MNKWHKSKKFKCPKCERSFDKHRQLKNHMQDSHPIKNNTPSEKIERINKMLGR